MPTISSKINPKEYEAISNYANSCGETISNLIRKVLIKEATFYGGFGGNKEYECGIFVPENITDEQETKIVMESYNKSRKILGFEAITEM